VNRVRYARLLRRAGVILALLCPVAWLYTGWHLAVETHHEHAVNALVEDHEHDRDHAGDHHGGVPAEDDGHHLGDHLIPDSLRPENGPVFAFDLEPSDVVLDGWELAATPTPTAPCEDVTPATDPPIESLQPRAPPVG
jgi:hypothetical protein